MGSNTLVDRVQGTIDADWFNQFIEALKGDIVPRTGGVPTDAAGDFGSAVFSFLNAYIASGGKINVASNYLTESGGNLKVFDSGTDEQTITPQLKNNDDINLAVGVANGALNLGPINHPDITDNQDIKTNLTEIEKTIFKDRITTKSVASVSGTTAAGTLSVFNTGQTVNFNTNSGFALCFIQGLSVSGTSRNLGLGLYDYTSSKVAIGPGRNRAPIGGEIVTSSGLFYSSSGGSHTLTLTVVGPGGEAFSFSGIDIKVITF